MSLIDVSGPGLTRHLALDNPTPNPGLARRLPPALAFRYHALPVAEDSGRITVAMVDPDDAAAREAVAAALGTTPCVVRGAPATIDALLAETWPRENHHALRLLVCADQLTLRRKPASSTADDVLTTYAQAMGTLLGAHVTHLGMAYDTRPILDALADEVGCAGYHLVILEAPAGRLFPDPADCQAVDRFPTSLLIVRQPRRPLKRILLVIQGEESDNGAVDWAVRLVRPSGAAVTVLAVAPTAVTMHHDMARPEPELSAWLTPETALGRQMRRVARRLANWEIEGALHLRQGPPGWQIRQEVAERDYNLVVVAAAPDDQRLPRLGGKVIGPVLRWTDQPVLIAKPTAV